MCRISTTVAFRRLHLLVSKLARRGSKAVDISPNAVSDPAASLDHPSKGQRQMTDTMFASELMQDTFPIRSGRNVKSAIGDAFDALKRRERNLPKDVLRERPRQWTERRVRALWNREARRVDHYEIQDLTAVAVEEAKIERQRLKAREDRLIAILAAADQGEMGEGAGAKSRGLRGVDLPGVGFTGADERTDQSAGWGR
jgi:hypothetical protein